MGSTPVPDPTKLTQDLVDRATAATVALIKVQLDALTARLDRLQISLDQRPEEIDKAVAREAVSLKDQIGNVIARLDRLQKDLDGQPETVTAAISDAIINLQALMNEKFKGVDQQFSQRDIALAAALSAQKASVDDKNQSNALATGKSEAAVTKQIDAVVTNLDTKTAAISANFDAQQKATNDKVDAQQLRIQAIESRAIGANENRDTTNNSLNIVFGAISALSVLLGIGAVLWGANRHPARARA
jgi:uncharacterized protein YhaN